MRWGTGNLRPWRTVVKTRELWLIDEVRVHIDDVDDLGSFIEFEAPVTKTLDVEACHRCIAELREAFGPAMGEHIAVSYCDLLGTSEDASPA